MLDIKLAPATEHKAKPDESKLGFGIYYTDNMFVIDHTEGIGWHDARIVPYQPLSIDPDAPALRFVHQIDTHNYPPGAL